MNTSFRMGKTIRSFRPSTYLYVLQIVLISTVGNVALADEPKLQVLFKEDFEHGMGHWQTTDPDPSKSVWKIIETGVDKKNHALRVTGPSTYKPPYRSPFSIALLKDIKVTDFVLTARIKNTAKNAGAHRDLCIIWGYQDPAHFYYVHYGAKPDPNACQIFIVNNAPRVKITDREAKGTPWNDDWHNIKIVRRVADGTMEAYFDDMKTPFMAAHDKTFTWGQVGIGTFDDHGNFDDIELRGEKANLK
jgi:hypothetical protein